MIENEAVEIFLSTSQGPFPIIAYQVGHQSQRDRLREQREARSQ
jgi:hypothetical protein